MSIWICNTNLAMLLGLLAWVPSAFSRAMQHFALFRTGRCVHHAGSLKILSTQSVGNSAPYSCVLISYRHSSFVCSLAKRAALCTRFRISNNKFSPSHNLSHHWYSDSVLQAPDLNSQHALHYASIAATARSPTVSNEPRPAVSTFLIHQNSFSMYTIVHSFLQSHMPTGTVPDQMLSNPRL